MAEMTLNANMVKKTGFTSGLVLATKRSCITSYEDPYRAVKVGQAFLLR